MDESDFEFDHEDSLEQAKIRRGAVNLQGYGSDETDTSEDDGASRFERRSGIREKAAEDLDDMFAQEDNDGETSKEKDSVRGKKKAMRYLEMDDIVGQEFDSIDYDSDSGEPRIEAFNMKAEMKEGRFDEAGNYIRNKKDPNEFHDKWLQGVTKKDIEKARIAHEKRERELKLKEAEAESKGPLDRISIWKELLTIMKPGETLLDALRRLGGGNSKKLKQKRVPKVYKRKRVKLSEESEETVEQKLDVPDDSPEEIQRKKDIERLTDLSVTASGYFDVYEDTWERILRNLKKEKAVEEDWMPPNARNENKM